MIRPLLLLTLCLGASQALAAPPNVVLLIGDDQAWTDYGFMGHPHIRTPHLDELAAQSLAFPRGYVPSSLCRASLATMITGRFPHDHSIASNDPPLPAGLTAAQASKDPGYLADRARMVAAFEKVPNLAKLLGAAGYVTHQSGKWWEGNACRCGGFTEGMTHGDPAAGGRHGDEGLKVGREGLEPVTDFVDRARAAGKPFYLWYAPIMPHQPHNPPARLLGRYKDKHESPFVTKYWAMCEWFDETVGELLGHLKKRGLAENTIVIYLHDNGWIQDPAAAKYGPKSKQSPYDGGVRTPILVRWPGKVEPRKSDHLAHSIDLAPTILAACGVKPPADLPGVNLLDARAVEKRDTVFGEIFEHDAVDIADPAKNLRFRWVVRGHWKLIVPNPVREPRAVVELFDLSKDPLEETNLAEKHPDTVTALRQVLDGWWAGPKTRPPDPKKPNVVFILADDLGVNDLACYGRGEHHTPNLDRLAKDGARFTAAYAACPVCSPTRAALLTGRHPARLHLTTFLPGRGDAPAQKLLHPTIRQHLPLEEVTLAESLKAAGYATACIGKWHLGGAGFGPEKQGFDTVYAGRANTPPTADEGGKGENDLTRQAEAFITANRDRPFFLYLAHNTPHIPLGANRDLVEKYKATFNPTYAAMIDAMDASVGRVMKALEDLKLADRTIVVFTSDNGGLHVPELAADPPTHNTPYRAGKGFLYEGGIRVPLIVRWPGVVSPAQEIATPVISTEWTPTLLAAASVEVKGLDGVSLVPLLRGRELEARPLYWHVPHYTNQGSRPAGAIRNGIWKLIEHYENGRLELFDLAKDPGERADLAATMPKKAAELRAELAAWRTTVGAQENTPNPTFDAVLHEKLYIDTDVSKLKPGATARLTGEPLAEWRREIDRVVRQK